jgi:hypothetical protein
VLHDFSAMVKGSTEEGVPKKAKERISIALARI